MKLPAGAFRPGFNIQFASTNIGKAIIAVDVVNKGTDNSELLKMIILVHKKYNLVPNKWLVDLGFESHSDLDKIDKNFNNCRIYMPVRNPKNSDPYKKKDNDSKAVGEWRERMGTLEAKETYKERASTAEFVNAQTSNKGLIKTCVRGIKNVRALALIYALTHNFYTLINT